MPALGSLECYVELAESGFRLNEYDTFWASNAVECYIAIPNQPSPFQIRLSATGYFSPSLAAYVFIDGVFQCNRFKRGLLPPTNGSKLEDSRVDFNFKSKDYTLQGGRMISHPWRFEKLNVGVLKHQGHSQKCRLLTNFPVVNADSDANINPHVAQNLGVIEVIILRCSDNPKDLFNPWNTPRLLRNPTTNRRQGSGQIGGRFDGPNDDPFGDDPYWLDGRGMDPPPRRNRYSRSHRHARGYDSRAYEAPRQSAHRGRHAERDWSPDDHDSECETTDAYTDEEVPTVREHRHHRRVNEDNHRRSHRRRARAPTPHPAYRSYSRNDGARRSNDEDPKVIDPLYEAFQAGLNLGAKHVQESRSQDDPRRRRDHYTGPTSHANTPSAKRDGTIPGIIINQFPGSGSAHVETVFDPETGRRITRVNLSAPNPRPFEFVIYSDSESDQDDVDGEPIHASRPRSGSPTTPAQARGGNNETLLSKIKNLLTGYEDRKSESGPTSKPSSFRSYVEEVVDEEYGGKSMVKKGNERELLAIEPSGGHVADEGNTDGKPTSNKTVNKKPHDKSVDYMPMPGAFPSAGSPQRLIEQPKRGFEAAVRQTKAPGQRTYGKLFSASGSDLRSQKEKDSDDRIYSWLDRTRVPDFKFDTQGKGRANCPAHIGTHPKVSFDDDRSRGRSRQRSPHHDRGVSHDRRHCSACDRYRRHHSGIHSHDFNNRDDQKNSWDANDQWDYGKFKKHTFRRFHNDTKTNTGNPDQTGWDKSNVNTNGGGWDKSNYQNNGLDSNNWNSNPNNQWSVNSNQNNGDTNNWTNDPEPAAATQQVDNGPKSEAKNEPKFDAPRSTHRTKEDIENVSKPREYWYKAPAGSRPGPPTSPPNSSRKRGTTIPGEPLPTISASAAHARNLEHQVCGGNGVESAQPVGHPVYWDTLERPFAVFRFRYRSRKCLETILGEPVIESPDELRGRLAALSRDQLIEEVLRRKDDDDVVEEKTQDEEVVAMKWD